MVTKKGYIKGLGEGVMKFVEDENGRFEAELKDSDVVRIRKVGDTEWFENKKALEGDSE